MKRIAIASIIVGVLSAILYAQTRGTPSNLRVRIDANGSIVTAAAAQVSPVTSVTFANARLAVDSSGNLLTVISGGTGVGTVTSLTATAPVIITPSPTTTTGVISCSDCGIKTDNITQFAQTTSANFYNYLTTKTGNSSNVVFADSPSITTPTFVTNITAPLVIGGTTASSTLSLKSTSGVGTTDAILFLTGNNGATEAARFTTGGNLGINTSTVTGGIVAKFHEVITASSGISAIFDKYEAGANSPALVLRSARGTPATPSKTLSGDGIGTIAGRGWQDTTSAFSGNRAAVTFVAAEDFTSTAQGANTIIQATPIGSVTPATQMTIAAAAWTIGSMVTPASTGTRYLCISTAGVVTSSATACSGT